MPGVKAEQWVKQIIEASGTQQNAAWTAKNMTFSCARWAATVLPYKKIHADKLHFMRYYALLKDNKWCTTFLKVMSELGKINPSEKLQNFRENNSHSLFFSLVYAI